MRPEDRVEAEEVFGEEAVRDLFDARGRQSDRRTEGWARKHGAPITDMRAGKPSGRLRYVDPLDDAGDSWTGPRSGASELDKPHRVRFREPTVGVGNTTLTREEYLERLAKLEAKNEEWRAIARAARELAEEAKRPPLLPGEVPRRLQPIAEQARLWARKRELGIHEPEADDSTATIDPPCYHCGQTPCVHQHVVLDQEDAAWELAADPPEADEYDETLQGLHEHPFDDVPGWAMDENGVPFDWYLAERAEEERRVAAEREATRAAADLEMNVMNVPSRRQWVSATDAFGDAAGRPRRHAGRRRRPLRPLPRRPDTDQEGRIVPRLQDLQEEPQGRAATRSGGQLPETKARVSVNDLDQLRQAAGTVAELAARCQDDVAVSVRLPDGRVLAPTTATVDMMRLNRATDDLRALLGG